MFAFWHCSSKTEISPSNHLPRFYCCLQEVGSGHSCSHSPNDFFASLLPVLLSVERRGHLVILHLFKSVPINLLSFLNKCGAKLRTSEPGWTWRWLPLTLALQIFLESLMYPLQWPLMTAICIPEQRTSYSQLKMITSHQDGVVCRLNYS